MSSWNTCCPLYARKINLAPTPVIITCLPNPNETNLVRGGSTDQERMDKPLNSVCSCKREAPPAYATGGKYTDSSFLTMKYVAISAKNVKRTSQQERCCAKPSITSNGITSIDNASNSSANNYTSDNITIAHIGCNICSTL